jgi:uncharacterized protein
MLLNEICESFLPQAAGHSAADVRIGLGYTAVLLENGRCGLAYTFRHQTGGGCCAFREAGSLCGRPAAELLAYANSTDVIGSAVALATVNALADPPTDSVVDALDFVGAGAEDQVGMVGFFAPLAGPLKERCKALYIFERRPDRSHEVLPEEAQADILPRCQVAIITATSLLNRTLDNLLGYCRNAREVMLLGPSTPYAPEVLAAKGVTILSGSRVTDAARALRVVSEAGGNMDLKSAVRKFSVRIRKT